MQEPGFEFYAAPFSRVTAACSTAESLRALRQGGLTPHCARFASVVGAADVLLLSDAFAVALGRELKFEIERVETNLGLFVDRILPPWPHAVATLPVSEVPAVCLQWRHLYASQEERAPDWAHLELIPDVTALVNVCRAAQYIPLDVVMVWAL